MAIGHCCSPHSLLNATDDQRPELWAGSSRDLQPIRIVPQGLWLHEIDPVFLLVRRRLGGIEFERHSYKNYTVLRHCRATLDGVPIVCPRPICRFGWFLQLLERSGRDGRIRTGDPLTPSQVRYPGCATSRSPCTGWRRTRPTLATAAAPAPRVPVCCGRLLRATAAAIGSATARARPPAARVESRRRASRAPTADR